MSNNYGESLYFISINRYHFCQVKDTPKNELKVEKPKQEGVRENSLNQDLFCRQSHGHAMNKTIAK